MTKELKFFIYLLEKYSERKGANAAAVLALWNERNLTDFIFDMYELYHCEAIENAFADIDSRLCADKQEQNA